MPPPSARRRRGGVAAADPPLADDRATPPTPHSPAPQPPQLPDAFLRGVGLSVWQNSGDGGKAPGVRHTRTPSNWGAFAEAKNYFGQRRFKAAWAHSTDFWNLYEQQIKLAKDSLGTNSFRFSFEWHRLQPNGPGPLDPEAVDRYHKIIDCIVANGMEPMCTLHHFTHPKWFQDKGAFETEDNIPRFVAYTIAAFREFRSKIRLWATFNEPNIVCLTGYIAGLWAPGKTMNIHKAGAVLLVLLKAHVAAWRALKAQPGGREACIGMVMQHMQFMPKSEWAIHIRLTCKWLTHWLANTIILNFFTTGVFKWDVPIFGTAITENVPSAVGSLDWWGINYYSYPCINGFWHIGASDNDELVSDIGFRVFPQGLYDSVKEASVLKVPMYITETGLADKEGKYRKALIEGHTDALLRAVSDGYDVRGMFYWTLMDNIEWHEGFNVKYGLFEWDPDKAGQGMQHMKLRAGSEELRRRYAEWPMTVDAVRKMAGATAAAGGGTIDGNAALSAPASAAAAAPAAPAPKRAPSRQRSRRTSSSRAGSDVTACLGAECPDSVATAK